jgi:hypothetical protein
MCEKRSSLLLDSWSSVEAGFLPLPFFGMAAASWHGVSVTRKVGGVVTKEFDGF